MRHTAPSASAAVCVMQSSDSFLTLFLGLEITSLPVYVLVLLAYRRPQSAEAALKYLVLGGTAATAATGSPTKRTNSDANTGWSWLMSP